MGKTDENGLEYHMPPVSVCLVPISEVPSHTSERDWLYELAETLFPYPLRKYPGRQKAFAFALCVTVETAKLYVKRGGNARISTPVLRRAEKLARDTAARLLVLADKFKAESDRRPVPAKRRGMFDVRIRDKTGIPRTGLARDGWRKNNEPF